MCDTPLRITSACGIYFNPHARERDPADSSLKAALISIRKTLPAAMFQSTRP
jgi:hypothetical protein